MASFHHLHASAKSSKYEKAYTATAAWEMDHSCTHIDTVVKDTVVKGYAAFFRCSAASAHYLATRLSLLSPLVVATNTMSKRIAAVAAFVGR